MIRLKQNTQLKCILYSPRFNNTVKRFNGFNHEQYPFKQRLCHLLFEVQCIVWIMLLGKNDAQIDDIMRLYYWYYFETNEISKRNRRQSNRNLPVQRAVAREILFAIFRIRQCRWCRGGGGVERTNPFGSMQIIIIIIEQTQLHVIVKYDIPLIGIVLCIQYV